MQTQMRKDNGIELISFEKGDTPQYIELENRSIKPRTRTSQLTHTNISSNLCSLRRTALIFGAHIQTPLRPTHLHYAYWANPRQDRDSLYYTITTRYN